MPALKPFVRSALRRLSIPRRESKQYAAPISVDDLTAEYLLIELPEELSPDAERAVTTLLGETHRNGLAAEWNDSEGYPSLFPPGASLFDTDDSTSRLQDVLSVLDRFAHVFQRRETSVVVLNAARIEENIRIAEHDPGKSGLIAQRNVDALAACLNVLPDERYQFVDSDAVPATSRDSHFVRFREALLYR